LFTKEMYFEKFLRLVELLTSTSNEIVAKIKFSAANPAVYLQQVR